MEFSMFLLAKNAETTEIISLQITWDLRKAIHCKNKNNYINTTGMNEMPINTMEDTKN
jgi:hypothetical protein